MDINRGSLFFNLSILSGAVFAIGVGPWGSDLFGTWFQPETKKNILITSGTIALVSFILYLSVKNAFQRSLHKVGLYNYSESALNYINTSGIKPEIIERIIKEGKKSESTRSVKYIWLDPDGKKYIVITNSKGVILEVAC